MSEDSKWKAAVTKDVTALYSAVEEIVRTLQLPALPQMLTSTQDPAIFFDQDENNDQDDDEQSPDNSPKVTPVADNLSHVPIESLYQITGMRSLRATENLTDDQSRICKQLRDTDFIARGIIKQEDAEYLANYYLSKLDPYIWHMCPDYKDLESFRRRSPTLTACILTVAALHDTKLGHLYSICSKEYRRLVANAMFERKIDMEYLRALVLGSYWLSDISWTLSGYAIRRASEFQLRRFYQDITDSIRTPGKVDQGRLQEAIDGIRVLYALYICDHHLSILYGRSSIMRDNESYITGWEAYLACSLSTDADRRIAGQICLMYLMNQIRETLGPEDTNSVLPDSALSKIAGFERDLDDWIARFSRHRRSQATPLTAWLRVPLDWYFSSTQAFFPDETHSSIRRTFTPLHAPHTQRVFCGYCGTHLSYWTEQPRSEADYMNVTLGSLLSRDLHALQDLDLLPEELELEDVQPTSAQRSLVQAPTEQTIVTQDENNGLTRTQRTGRSGGLAWFEELLEGSRLGRTQNIRRGVGVSPDGFTSVEWEISEYIDDGTEEMDSASTPTGSKRKIGDVGGNDAMVL
ncbi:hypothetical protein ABEF94_010677 [Exophiala dermatitidis]